MNAWLDFARGPAFVFAFSFMLLGLARHVVVTVWDMVRTVRRAGDKTVPYRSAATATLKWLFPLGKLHRQPLFSVTSILFHVAILVVPLFLAGHIALWARGLGWSWPALSNEVADVLTITAVVTAAVLLVLRIASSATRALSRLQDFVLPPIIAVPFATGFLVMHPQLNPFSFEATLFVHIMSANLVFILMPITKLSHAVLLPSTQLVGELGWRWPMDSGAKVAAALHKEEEPV